MQRNKKKRLRGEMAIRHQTAQRRFEFCPKSRSHRGLFPLQDANPLAGFP